MKLSSPAGNTIILEPCLDSPAYRMIGAVWRAELWSEDGHLYAHPHAVAYLTQAGGDDELPAEYFCCDFVYMFPSLPRAIRGAVAGADLIRGLRSAGFEVEMSEPITKDDHELNEILSDIPF